MAMRVEQRISTTGVHCNDSNVEILWSKADVLMSNKESVIPCENDTSMILF